MSARGSRQMGRAAEILLPRSTGCAVYPTSGYFLGQRVGVLACSLHARASKNTKNRSDPPANARVCVYFLLTYIHVSALSTSNTRLLGLFAPSRSRCLHVHVMFWNGSDVFIRRLGDANGPAASAVSHTICPLDRNLSPAAPVAQPPRACLTPSLLATSLSLCDSTHHPPDLSTLLGGFWIAARTGAGGASDRTQTLLTCRSAGTTTR